MKFFNKNNHFRSLTITLKEYKITIFKTNVWILAFQITYLLFYLFVSNTSYYVEVENGAVLRDVMQKW